MKMTANDIEMSWADRRRYINKIVNKYGPVVHNKNVEEMLNKQVLAFASNIKEEQSVVAVPQKRTSSIILIDGVPYIKLESGELMLLPDSDYEEENK